MIFRLYVALEVLTKVILVVFYQDRILQELIIVTEVHQFLRCWAQYSVPVLDYVRKRELLLHVLPELLMLRISVPWIRNDEYGNKEEQAAVELVQGRGMVH